MKTLIFDFDGVIINSLKTIIDIFNDLSDKYGFKKTDNIELARQLGTREFLRNTGISLFKLPTIIKNGLCIYNKKIKDLSTFPGLKEELIKLKEEYKLGILTSNSKNNVEAFLKNNDLENLFDFIFAESSVFGKAHILRKLIKEKHLNKQEVVYIGDETRDIEAARKAGVKMAAVSWGYTTRERLEKENPNIIIDKPEELLEIKWWP